MAAPLRTAESLAVEEVGLRLIRGGLPEFDVEIEDIRPLDYRERIAPGIAYIATSVAHMTDGSRYVVRDVRPYQEFDRPVLMTTPLGTRVNGVNTDQAAEFAQGGSRTIIFGFNQAAAHPTSLAQDTQSYVQIAKHFEQEEGVVPAEHSYLNYGASRGGQGGLGIMAYGNLLGLSVELGLHIDDCLPEKTDTKMTLTGLPPQNLLQELAITRKSAERWPDESFPQYLKRMKRWTETIGFTPTYVRAQIHSGRALWAGEAGTFTEHLTDEQIVILHAHNRNRLNGRDSYHRKLARRPFANIIDENDQWHMDIVRWQVFKGAAGKILTAQQQLQRGTDARTLVELLDYKLFDKTV